MAKKSIDAVNNNAAMSAGFEKFQLYAEPRQIRLKPKTYGFYEVRKGETKKTLGAVKAVLKDGTKGWVINWADRQRKFVAESDTGVIVGKQVSSSTCLNARKRKKPALLPVED
ncbi:MAG: hypothetical protein J6C85_05565 [Alphaproteobacteria bacterium]|nr:hypothetical protein [Alphaproteobacteria bacterium]